MTMRDTAFTITLGTSAQGQSVIGLFEVDDRSWLFTPEKKSFFAHGIAHTHPYG